ncbi:MAG: tetratricopeptide repeat protein [Bacteroidetes bacterium]|nr:tetratricopeptide repeat protein [Bacteroidota bacterium]
MKKYFAVLTVMVMVLTTACDKKGKELKEIDEMATQMDSVLKANPVLGVEQKVEAEQLIDEYLEFVNQYPNDSLSIEFLMKSAMLYHVMPDYGKELAVLERLVAQYPESPAAPQALAIGARVSEDNLRNYEQARVYLKQIQEKYPESPYSVNIDLQVEYVGDAEGLLEAIMERTGVKADTVFAPKDSIDAVKK